MIRLPFELESYSDFNLKNDLRRRSGLDDSACAVKGCSSGATMHEFGIGSLCDKHGDMLSKFTATKSPEERRRDIDFLTGGSLKLDC